VVLAWTLTGPRATDELGYTEERSRPISVQAAEDVWLTAAHASADAARTGAARWAAWVGTWLHKALADAAAFWTLEVR
jgi:hypothetical protein